MKKINCIEILRDRLGITLLFFVSLAEVVGSKYKKFRHLPKKAVAVCVAATMIVVALPVNILLAETAESSSELPGARVETNEYGDVFLGGNYIEVGKWLMFNCYCERQKQTSAMVAIAKEYNGKISAYESKNLGIGA